MKNKSGEPVIKKKELSLQEKAMKIWMLVNLELFIREYFDE